jgi:hypothetical protein
MTATANPPVKLPDPAEIRGRLDAIEKESAFLRRLLRLIVKRPPAPTLTTSAGTGSAYAGNR